MKARTILVIVFLQRGSILMMAQNTIKLKFRSLGNAKSAHRVPAKRGCSAHTPENCSSVIPAQAGISISLAMRKFESFCKSSIHRETPARVATTVA
jgi:hypothetical protein